MESIFSQTVYKAISCHVFYGNAYKNDRAIARFRSVGILYDYVYIVWISRLNQSLVHWWTAYAYLLLYNVQFFTSQKERTQIHKI